MYMYIYIYQSLVDGGGSLGRRRLGIDLSSILWNQSVVDGAGRWVVEGKESVGCRGWYLYYKDNMYGIQKVI